MPIRTTHVLVININITETKNTIPILFSFYVHIWIIYPGNIMEGFLIPKHTEG